MPSAPGSWKTISPTKSTRLRKEQLVATGARRDVDRRARLPPVLRGEVGGLNLDLAPSDIRGMTFDRCYTSQIAIAFFRLSIGSRPGAGEYSCVTNPWKPRSAMACMTKR